MTELSEEMGIEGVALRYHFNFWFECPGLRMWGALFSCTYDGEMVLQPEEVESGEFMSVAVGLISHVSCCVWDLTVCCWLPELSAFSKLEETPHCVICICAQRLPVQSHTISNSWVMKCRTADHRLVLCCRMSGACSKLVQFVRTRRRLLKNISTCFRGVTNDVWGCE